jgi:hypothetical protein
MEDQSGAAWDGDVTMSLDFARAASVRATSGELRAMPGDAFIVADVLLSTPDGLPGPFCRRGYGALLVDGDGQRFETIPGENQVKGVGDLGIHGSFVCDVLPPESASWERLVFQLPLDDRAVGIAVWNPSEPADRLGRTYVYFRASSHSPVPDLGATAWGPSRDR